MFVFLTHVSCHARRCGGVWVWGMMLTFLEFLTCLMLRKIMGWVVENDVDVP